MTPNIEPTTAQAGLSGQANGGACSRCERELDTTGYPRWCRKCRAANKREYEATKKQMSETRGFAAGVSAMRAYLAENFNKYGAGAFTGTEIALTIMRVKGPDVA